MNIVEAIDAEIAKLQSVRAILISEGSSGSSSKGSSVTSKDPSFKSPSVKGTAIKRRGRPAGSRNVATSLTSMNEAVSPLSPLFTAKKTDPSPKSAIGHKKGGMSAEGRAAVAAAMRKRWEANRKAAESANENTNPSVKKTSTKSAAKKTAKKSVKAVKAIKPIKPVKADDEVTE